ncbi:MAG: CAP domain-containing protein, partial [Gemmatimonadaceae bacterium]
MSRRIIGLTALAAVVFAAALPLGRLSTASAAGNCTVDASIDTEERAFATLINNYRAQNGLGPLAVSYGLSKASQWKSGDMAANDYFAHDDLSRSWDQRIRDCGYGYNTWLGENIAAGYQT